MRLRTRTLVLGVLVGCGLVWGAYIQYQDPRVRELFGPAPPSPRPERIGPPTRMPPDNRKQIRPRPSKAPRNPTPAAATRPQSRMDNKELASTLLGILRARRLASGISLRVSDEVLGVVGRVDGEKTRQDILDVLEKGRGPRRLDSSLLTVSSSPPQ